MQRVKFNSDEMVERPRQMTDEEKFRRTYQVNRRHNWWVVDMADDAAHFAICDAETEQSDVAERRELAEKVKALAIGETLVVREGVTITVLFISDEIMDSLPEDDGQEIDE